MIIVNVKENENLEKALRRFKKKYEKIGILKELRNRTSFTKPSVKKRMVKNRAMRRQELFAKDNY
jgi:small subunit ribosomal protein S21